MSRAEREQAVREFANALGVDSPASRQQFKSHDITTDHVHTEAFLLSDGTLSREPNGPYAGHVWSVLSAEASRDGIARVTLYQPEKEN